MKSIKWMLLGAALALLTVTVISGTLGNVGSDNDKLYIVQKIEKRIVQSDEERDAKNLTEVLQDEQLIPAVYEGEVTKSENVQKWRSGEGDYLFSAGIANVIDKFVSVENIGNIPAYVRTWFAFEMGDMSEAEFEAAIKINRNETVWTWDAFDYGVEIDGKRYAVVCAKYNTALDPQTTTSNPSLLQIMLYNTVSTEDAQRLDGNGDGKYEIKVFSRAVSDENAWGGAEITHPWY